MNINSDDILIMDECEIDNRIINNVRVNIRACGKTLCSVSVRNMDAAKKLMSQLWEHQETLVADKKRTKGKR
jgi:hypothetical protein